MLKYSALVCITFGFDFYAGLTDSQNLEPDEEELALRHEMEAEKSR